MSHEPSSPTAAPPANLFAKPPPLTPYRGGPATPSSAAGAGGGGASPGVAAFRGPSPPLWDQALEQEKRLRAELRKKSFWDPDVRRLRGALQGTYEALLFGHYEFAAAHEVEPCLWKAVFYKPIEEFRNRVRALEGLAKGSASGGAGGAPTAAAGAAAAPVQLATPEEARAQLARTTSAYLRFLDDALAFYRKTVWKLQWVYGNMGAVVDLDAALQNEIQECVPRASGARVPDARPSVHRCLIYLGDLCRYQSMALKERPTSARPLWERAMSYYRQAARVLPASGNPYNQMAVMSYYTNDELRAVYYYFRSLAVAMPFVTARENLLILFEKNRAKYINLAAAHAAAALQGGADAEARAAAGHVTDVSVRFVRLHGLLFDRINLDTLPEVLRAASRDLDTLLGHPGCRVVLQKANEVDQLLFHLAIMSIFAVHNVTSSPAGGGGMGGGGGGGYAAAAQRAEQRSHALTVAMRFAAAVAGCTAGMAEVAAAGGGVGDVETGFGAVSAACHVMLAWMVSNPYVLTSEPSAAVPPPPPLGATGASQAGAGGGCDAPEVAAEVGARAGFLSAAARLAAHLADLTRRRAHDQDWQDPAMRHRSLPEDAELVGFGPLSPVVTVASTWPAAAEAPGGAAVLAVRVARMLQALRHLDDALGPPRTHAASGHGLTPGAATAARDLARAVHEFKAAVAQAVTTSQPQPQQHHLTGAATAAAAGGVSPKSGLLAHHPQPSSQQQQNGQHHLHHQHQHQHQHHLGVGVHPAAQHAQAQARQPQSQQPQSPQQLQPAPGSQGRVANGMAPAGQALGGQQQHAVTTAAATHAVAQHPILGGHGFAATPQQPMHDRQYGEGVDIGISASQSQRVQGAPTAHPGAPGSTAQPPISPPLPRRLHAAAAAGVSAGPSAANGGAPSSGGSGQLAVARMPENSILAAADVARGLDHHRAPFTVDAALGTGVNGGTAGAGLSKTADRAAGGGGGDGGGGGGATTQDEDAAEDEIVYQPPRPGSAGQRLAGGNVGVMQAAHVHRRSSSGGGGGVLVMHPFATSQEGARGLLSKQPSAGGSSAAAVSLHPSREASRDGSTILIRSPSVLSTGELHTSGGVGGGGGVGANTVPGMGLILPYSGGGIGGRLSSSGLTSPSSTYGNTVPPSPQQQPNHLIWETFTSVSNSGGTTGGGGGGSGSGMAPMLLSTGSAGGAGQPPAAAAAGMPARPPSPAVGDLPGAGSIGLLQHLLHSGGAAGGGGAAAAIAAGGGSGTTALVVPPAFRRVSAGAASGGGSAGPLSVLAGAAPLGAAGSATRPGSSGAAVGGSGGGPHIVPRRPSASLLQAAQGAAGGSGLGALGLRMAATGTHAAAGAGFGAGATAIAAGRSGGLTTSSSPTAQILQLEHLPQPLQPQQLLLASDALSAPFIGLPASLQHRAQPIGHPPQPQLQTQAQQHRSAGQLLLTAGGLVPPAPGGGGTAGVGATLGPGVQHLTLGSGGLAPQPLLPFGGVGLIGAAGATAGASTATADPNGVNLGAMAGAQQRQTTPTTQPHAPHLAWPSGGDMHGGAGGGGVAGGAGTRYDMSYFATAAGNYQAAALAEATAEATAVAMADDVLQAMDADDGAGFAAPTGTTSIFTAAAAAAATTTTAPGAARDNGPAGVGGGMSYYNGTSAAVDGVGAGGDDYMDLDRFSPAVAAAAAGYGPLGQAPVTREPSAASDGFFAASCGTVSGTGILAPFSGCSSGSGSGFGSALAAAAAAAAAGGAGVSVRRSVEGDGHVAGLGSSAAAGAGALAGQHQYLQRQEGQGQQTYSGLEGFGSWGVVPVLPEHLTEYHQQLKRGAAGGGWGGGGAGGASGLVSGGGNGSGAGAGGSAGAPAAGATFGEDLSCLSFLTAQLQGPGAGQGAQSGAGQG